VLRGRHATSRSSVSLVMVAADLSTFSSAFCPIGRAVLRLKTSPWLCCSSIPIASNKILGPKPSARASQLTGANPRGGEGHVRLLSRAMLKLCVGYVATNHQNLFRVR